MKVSVIFFFDQRTWTNEWKSFGLLQRNCTPMRSGRRIKASNKDRADLQIRTLTGDLAIQQSVFSSAMAFFLICALFSFGPK
jgi:hypothetical protein